MVKYSSERLDSIFKALSDGTRRAMLARLASSELTVTELAEPYDMSLAAVSKHLKVLEQAKFVEKVKEGRIFRCRADLRPLKDVSQLLEDLGSFWRDQLSSLEAYLSDEKLKKGDRHGSKKSK